MPRLSIQNLTKDYASAKALDRVSFDVADGEFVTLLGPSGCGKSTTLFAIAGLDKPTDGSITLDDRVLFDGARGVFVTPEARNCGLVFQSYALWPHMTVRQNVAFPLKIRGIAKKELEEQVEQSLALVEMQPLAARYPHELSGGQQQRVALARTLVYRPSLLLLDEPLSNLDAKLRLRARGWLKQLQTQLGLTTIFVTHDQTEALSLSDRIVVMDGGRIMQVGTPQEVYRDPATPFIADFIGGSNFLTARVVTVNEGQAHIALPDGQTLRVSAGTEVTAGEQVTIAVRPEAVCLAKNGTFPDSKVNLLRGRIVEREFLGPRYLYAMSIANQLVRFETVETLSNDDTMITVPSDSCTVFAFRGAG